MEIDPTDAAASAAQFADGDDEEYVGEARRRYSPVMTLKDYRAHAKADKAAGQCRADLEILVEASAIYVDVAVGDATAPSYRRPPPTSRSPPPSATQTAASATYRGDAITT